MIIDRRNKAIGSCIWLKVLNIRWWITSALEANIGLNAVAQFAAEYNLNIPQGLGTGRLFNNNIDAPLLIEEGKLRYDPKGQWSLSLLSGKEMN